MINVTRPNLIIVAGPNGAGKSTVADFLLSNRSLDHYVNADVIAKGMASADEGDSGVSAGRILLGVVHDAISNKQTVAFESTMSGLMWRKMINDARCVGYDVTVCYVGVLSPDISTERVAKRVAEGGHDIPKEAIRRRYRKSLALGLGEYRKLADYWYFFDNSSDRAKLVACREAGAPEVILEQEIWNQYQRISIRD
jgi:predicted ABC-type ATPase